MEKLKFISMGHCLIVLVLSCFLASCVNPEYDLEKVVMDEATLFEGISLPVGDVEKMTIEQVLFTDGELPQSVEKSENGDLYIDLFSGSYSASFDVPNSFNFNNIQFEDSQIDLKTGSLAGQSTSSIPAQNISFSSLNGGKPFTLQMPLDIVSDLPSEILDVRKATLEANLECHLISSAAPVTILSGLQIIFPDYIYIAKNSTSANYNVKGDHVVEFLMNTPVTTSNPLSLKLLLTKIELPSGSIKEVSGKRQINRKGLDFITVKGDYYFNTKDVSIIPERVSLIVGADLGNATVKTAEVSLDVDMSIDDKEMEVGELPDLLKGDNICVDLYNPQFQLKVANNTPLTCSMTADLTATGANGNNTKLSITKEDGVSLRAHDFVNYLISRRPTTPDASGTVNIVKPEIGTLIKNVPDVIRFSNCNITTSKDYVNVFVGQNYGVNLDYSVYSPLSFGEELLLSFTQDVENLGLQLDINVASVIFEMNLINSIPVDFTLSAIAIDEQGNEVSDTRITLDKTIKAGSHLSPITTPIKLELKNTKGEMNVDGLRLTMKATAPDAAFIGIPLNMNQGFEIKNIVMSLPDGIVLEF